MASEDDNVDQEELEPELLTAGQALIVVFVVVALALTYAYRWWKRQESESAASDSFTEYEFELPSEKQAFAALAQARPDQNDKAAQREWHKQLMQLHMKRVLKVVELHERVQADLRTQTTLYKRGVAVSLLPQVEAAQKLLNREVQECGMLANQLKQDWGRTIFAEAHRMKQGMDEKDAQHAAERERQEQAQREEEITRQALEMEKKEEELKRRRAEQLPGTLIQEDDNSSVPAAKENKKGK